MASGRVGPSQSATSGCFWRRSRACTRTTGPETVTLLDWGEFAARAPAACDLQWHRFLHFWAYPPDGQPPEARAPLRDFYLAELEAMLGRPIDREEFERTWDLGWLRVMSMIGFCLADVANPAAPEARQRAKAAIALARAILDA
jgi:hypothetical protein